MQQITISNVEDAIVVRLRQIASEEGVPLEESLRRMIVDAAQQRQPAPSDAWLPIPTD